MSDKLESKLKELELRQQQVAILEEEIRLLSIEDKRDKKPRALSLQERFPKHSTVRLTGRNENHRLRRKKAEVIGYTNCYIRLERKGEEFLRAPENLELICENGE